MSVTNNKFIDLASADILLNKLSILRLTIDGNESILKDIPSNLQFLSSDTTSNIDELIITNNNVNKTIAYSGDSKKVVLESNAVTAQANTTAVGINLSSKQNGSLIKAAGNTVTAGTRFILLNASRMMIFNNVINNLTDASGALQCLNADVVKAENNDLYNNAADYSFKGSAAVIGSFVGPGVPSIAVSSGSTWRRTDGGANTTFYIREGSSWVAK